MSFSPDKLRLFPLHTRVSLLGLFPLIVPVSYYFGFLINKYSNSCRTVNRAWIEPEYLRQRCEVIWFNSFCRSQQVHGICMFSFFKTHPQLFRFEYESLKSDSLTIPRRIAAVQSRPWIWWRRITATKPFASWASLANPGIILSSPVSSGARWIASVRILPAAMHAGRLSVGAGLLNNFDNQYTCMREQGCQVNWFSFVVSTHEREREIDHVGDAVADEWCPSRGRSLRLQLLPCRGRQLTVAHAQPLGSSV